MTQYHAILKKKPQPAMMMALVEPTVAALRSMNVKILKMPHSHLDTIVFESDKTLAQLRSELADCVELVSPIVKVKVEPIKGKVSPKGIQPSLRAALLKIGFDHIWQDPLFDGGKSMIVGILDTGVDDLFGYFGNPSRILESMVADSTWLHQTKMFHGRVCLAEIARNYQLVNGLEFQGALPEIRAYDAQVLGPGGDGTSETVHQGFVWMLERNPLPDLITLSLGSSMPDVILINDVLNCIAAGIGVSCAAGNEGGDIDPENPSTACDGTLDSPADAIDNMAVSATNGGVEDTTNPIGDLNEYIQKFASRNPRRYSLGSKQQHVVAAPGVNILVGVGEGSWTGTSLADPLNAATLLSTMFRLKLSHPELSATDRYFMARDIVQKTAIDLGYASSGHWDAGQAYCIQGYGRIRADAAWDKAAGNSSPTVPIDKVEFFLDDSKFDEKTNPVSGDLYRASKDLEITQDEQTFQFYAIAWSQGQSQKSNVSSFKVKKTTPPQVVTISCTIEAPQPGDEYTQGSVDFKVHASAKTA